MDLLFTLDSVSSSADVAFVEGDRVKSVKHGIGYILRVGREKGDPTQDWIHVEFEMGKKWVARRSLTVAPDVPMELAIESEGVDAILPEGVAGAITPDSDVVPATVAPAAVGESSPALGLVAVESVAAEVVAPTRVDVVELEELSYDEERDRLHLERKVERAFYEAGKALRELRDRRLYRSTHPTFEGYCRDRFGFRRRHPYQLIDAASVVDNLLASAPTNSSPMCANGAQTEMTTNGAQLEMTTSGAQTELLTNGAQIARSPIGAQILPTNERQVRSLVQLEPEQQREAWQQAVVEAGGKVPSGRIVKDIVERMQQVESPPESIARAHHLTLEPGGLVEVRCPGNEKIHARLGRIAKVREKTVEVWVRDTETMLMVKHSLKHPQVEAVVIENEPGCLEVAQRIDALRGKGLDPFELEVLALLERAVVLTPVELGYLEAIDLKFQLAPVSGLS
jgi:hypothetical protein